MRDDRDKARAGIATIYGRNKYLCVYGVAAFSVVFCRTGVAIVDFDDLSACPWQGHLSSAAKIYINT